MEIEKRSQNGKLATEEAEKDSYIVTGYASTFEPYRLFEKRGITYFEKVEPTAFRNADMSDVIFQYDHTDKVLARTTNGTLKLDVDERGLKVTADLSSTKASRELYEEIRSGLVNQMSFGFTVKKDMFEKRSNTRIITELDRIFDVSAVSRPANPDTNISARSYISAIEEEQEQLNKKRKLLRLKLEFDTNQ